MKALHMVLGLTAFIFSTPGVSDFERTGPEPLHATFSGIGKRIPDQNFTDLEGKSGALSDYQGKQGIVLILNVPDCPIGRKYLGRVEELRKEYEPQGLAFLMVGVSEWTTEKLKPYLTNLGVQTRYLPQAGTIAATLSAKTSTEVFLLDRTRTLVYRGPVDDQHGLGFSLPAPKNHLLQTAMNELLAGKKISASAFSAPGCFIKTPPAPLESHVTFHHQISRLVQMHCQRCHRSGEAGPFELKTLADLQERLPMIRFVLEKKIMPPWFAAPSERVWANDPSMSDADRALFLKWIAEGAPEGSVADAPLPVAWTEGWAMGEPDVVLEAKEEIAIPASGVMPYQYVSVKTNFAEDKWITASEVRNTAAGVVHHVLVLFRNDAVEPVGDELGLTNGYLAAKVPGNSASIYPLGMAKKLPKGAELLFQLHYTPNGVATKDLPKLGLKFATTPPSREMVTRAAYETKFKIPALAPAHTVTANYLFKKEFRILSFMPHMHLRGKAFKYELIHPDGKTETLLDVPRYDFNWQLTYQPLYPIAVPAGATLKATAVYDNSPENPANPDPTKDVVWGDQTDSEMMIGYFEGFER